MNRFICQVNHVNTHIPVKYIQHPLYVFAINKLQFVCSIFTKKNSVQIDKMLAKKDNFYSFIVGNFCSISQRVFVKIIYVPCHVPLVRSTNASPQLPLAFYHEIQLRSCCFLPLSSLCYLRETVVQMNPTVLDQKQPIFISVRRL